MSPIPDVQHRPNRLDHLTNCPLGVRCESCGRERDDLRRAVVDFPRMGAACMTLCSACRGSDVQPPVTISTALRLVGQHAAHIGLDLDDAAELAGVGAR
jgi:fructose-1,6-bisphosphatase/inositol monophosphatase family enzyme